MAKPFLCLLCGARYVNEGGLARHGKCKDTRALYTPLFARVFSAAAEADAALLGRAIVFGSDGQE